eukprot:s1836_g11.t1
MRTLVRLKKWIECLTECFSQEKVSTLSLLFISREDARTLVRLKKWIECLTECFSQEKVRMLNFTKMPYNNSIAMKGIQTTWRKKESKSQNLDAGSSRF